MPKKRIPKTWQTLERAVADFLSPFFGVKLFRNILSGSNNRTDDGEPRYGDVAFPKGTNLVVECKYRSGISFHRFYDQVVSDAEKAGVNLENVILFSKEKGKKPILATISLPLLSKLLEVVQESGKIRIIFGSGESQVPTDNNQDR